MNKFIMIFAVFFAMNGLLSLTGFLFPTIPTEKILTIQLWMNALLLFCLFLKSSVASWLPTI